MRFLDLFCRSFAEDRNGAALDECLAVLLQCNAFLIDDLCCCWCMWIHLFGEHIFRVLLNRE